MAEIPSISTFDKVYKWFNKDPKSAFITVLLIALLGACTHIITLYNARMEDKDKSKDEIVKELKERYDPKFKEIKDTVMSTSGKMNSTLKDVDQFIDEQRK